MAFFKNAREAAEGLGLLKPSRPAALSESLPQHQTVLDAAIEGICGLTQDGQILFANTTAAHILGMSKTDLVGKDIHAALHSESRCVPQCELNDLTKLYSEQFVKTLVNTINDVTLVKCHFKALDEGTPLAGIVTFVDISYEQEAIRNEIDLIRATQTVMKSQEVVNELQRTVEPVRPHIEGIELAHLYLPADQDMPTGGDLYDWQVLDDNTLYAAIIDVTGKGIQATKDAVTVIHTVRALVLTNGLDVAVEQATNCLRRTHPHISASGHFLRFDPLSGLLEMAGAGHLPAFIVSPNGACREFTSPGMVLGYPGAKTKKVTSTVLNAGDTIVLYTDGLVETTKDFIAGMERLQKSVIKHRNQPSEAFCHLVMEEALSVGERRDDSLILTIRRTFTSPVSEMWKCAADPIELHQLRHDVNKWAVTHGASEQNVYQINLLLSEMLLWSFLEASDSSEAICVEGLVAQNKVIVTVYDDAKVPWAPPNDLSQKVCEPYIDNLVFAHPQDGSKRSVSFVEPLTD